MRLSKFSFIQIRRRTFTIELTVILSPKHFTNISVSLNKATSIMQFYDLVPGLCSNEREEIAEQEVSFFSFCVACVSMSLLVVLCQIVSECDRKRAETKGNRGKEIRMK